MNTGKAIFFGLALFALFLSGPAAAASLICKSEIIPLAKAAHKFTILLPTNFGGSIAHKDEYGETDNIIGPKVGVGTIEWEFPGIEDRLEFYQYSRKSAPYLAGFAVSYGGNIMIMRIETTETNMPFRFHSTYTGPFSDTITGTCQ